MAIAAGPAAFALTAPSPVTREVTIALVQPGVIGGSRRAGGGQRAADQDRARATALT